MEETGTITVNVELPDGALVKISFPNSATQETILKHLSTQTPIQQSEYFGLQRFLISPQPGSAEEWVFLSDDLPVGDQGTLGKLRLRIRFFALDPLRTLTCPKTAEFMCNEALLKLSKFPILPEIEVAVQIAAFYLHLKLGDYASSKRISSMNDLMGLFPDLTTKKLFKDEAALKQIGNAHALLFGLNTQEVYVKFLSYLSESLPALLATTFEAQVASQTETNVQVEIAIGPDGIRFSRQGTLLSKLPLDRIFDWKMTEVVGGAAQANTISKTRIFHESAEMLTIKVKEMKGRTGALSRAIDSANQSPPQTSSASGNKKYIISLVLDTEHLHDLEFAIRSSYSNDFRMVNTLQFYSDKASLRERKRLELMDSGIIDDPVQEKSRVYCTALESRFSELDDQLIFVKGDEIQVEKKLGGGFYLGSCNDLSGIFREEQVLFKRRSVADVSKKKLSALMRHDSLLKAHWTLADKSHGDIISVTLMDGSRMMFAITFATTASDVIGQIADKLEMKETSIFQLVEISEGLERWLHPKIPVLLQGVAPSSKIFLKIQAFWKPVQEIVDPVAIHLFYEQVKQQVLDGSIHVSESDYLELLGFHLQALLSDNDKKLHKPGYFPNLEGLVPQGLQSKGNSWWQKNMFLVHQKHISLSKTQAERAYIKTLQLNPGFGWTYFPCVYPEGDSLCVSKEGVKIVSTNNPHQIKESFRFAETLLDWRNSSFVVELEVKKADDSRTTMNYFPKQLSNVIDLLWIYERERKRGPLIHLCTQIRRSLGILQISLDRPVESRSTSDPELLAETLKNGVILCRLANKVKPRTHPSIEVASDENGELPEYLCLDNASAFLDVCRASSTYWTTGFGVPEEDLFSPEDLYNFSHEGFQKVLTTIAFVLRVGRAPSIAGGENSNRLSFTGNPLRELVVDKMKAEEHTYVFELEESIKSLVVPLQGIESFPEKASALMGLLEGVLAFDQTVLQGIRESPSTHLGENLLEKAGEFSPYVHYIQELEQAFAIFYEVRSNQQVVDIFVATGGLYADLKPGVLVFSALLHVIMRPLHHFLNLYKQLKELRFNTPEKHADFPNLSSVIERVRSQVQIIKTIKKVINDFETTDRISGLDGLDLVPLGPLLFSGGLIWVDKAQIRNQSFDASVFQSPESKFHIFLFEKLLLRCRREIGERIVKYAMVDKIALDHVLVKHQISGTQMSTHAFNSLHLHAFEIVRLDFARAYTVVCSTYEDKTRWLNSLDQVAKRKASALPSSDEETDPALVAKIVETREKRRQQKPNQLTEKLKVVMEDFSA